jgi:hypothetical protein
MSDKLVRDEVLRSHRYVSLSSDTAKLLFWHLMLSSDSLSNAEATTTSLSIIMARSVSEEAAAALLAELADHDLVRLYEADGKRYVHIPRSRQRIRYLRGKHPRPPRAIEDNEIAELIAKVGIKSGGSQTEDIPPPETVAQGRTKQEARGRSDPQAEQREPHEVNDLQSKVGPKLREVKRSAVVVDAKRTSTEAVDKLSSGVTWAEFWTAKGKALGINARKGETEGDYCRRIIGVERERGRR